MARSQKWWLFATVAVLVMIASLPFTCMIWEDRYGHWRIKLPKTRDSSLVGTWKGRARPMPELDLESFVITFRADGTGECMREGKSFSRLEWGTENGVLYTRRMLIDAWSGSQHPYAESNDQTSIRFGQTRYFDVVAEEMKRQ